MLEENRKVLSELGFPVDFLEAIPGGYHLCEDKPEEGYPLVYMSDRFLEIFGWTREDIKTKFDNKYSPMVHPDDKEAGEANYSDCTDQGRPFVEDRIFRVQGKNGYVWVSSTANSYEVNGKKYIQAIHAAVNTIVDEGKQENKQLQESKTEADHDIEILKNQLEIIKSVAGVYICLYYMDMSDYSYIELGTTAEDVEDLIGKRGDAHIAFEQMCKYLVADEFVDSMREFTEVETVNDRLKNTNWITRQFIDTKGNWTEGWFIAADRDEHGNCKHAVWGVRDISEQKNVELSYQHELEETNNIVANASMGIWSILMFDGEEPRMRANPKMRELLSLPDDVTDEVEIYHAWYSRVKPEALDSVAASVAAMIAGERNENTYLWNDPVLGDQYVRCGGVAEKIEGKGYILRGYHYNVNNEVLKEQQSKLAKEKTNAILEAVSQEYHTIWLIDKNTHEMELIRSNGKATIKKAIAVAKEESDYDKMLLWYVERYVADEDRERVAAACSAEVILREIENTAVYTVNYQRINEEGKRSYHQMAFSKVGEFGFTLAFNDIDRMIREEQKKQRLLETALAAAEEANKAKTTFLFNMSHDIRTPMNAITGFRDLLEKHQDEPEKRQDYLDKIKYANEVLLSIINNVLEMTRIEQGHVEVEEVAVDLGPFCVNLDSMFSEMMKEKGITFTVESRTAHKYVFGDPTKVREIFMNLLSNAYKYTNPGGAITVLSEELPCEREGYIYLKATISDTGIGMSEEFLAHIFEPFSREQNTTDSKVEGTGLGMPIVKRLVDMMDGTIDISSKKDVGTTIVVTLPHRIATESDCHEAVVSKVEPDVFSGKRILLAEDNELNAEIATEILREAGFIVDHAEDGRVCCDRLMNAAENYYDLILMDIQMPGMNGYDAAVFIRKLSDPGKANIPIVAMTANAFEEDKKEAIRCGMNGHLAKPINVKELMVQLAKILQ